MCGGLWKVIYCWGFELFHNGVCVGDNPGAVMGVMMLFNVLLILNYYLLCIMTADIPVCTVYMLGVSLKLWNITQSMLCRVQLITFPFQQKAHTIDRAPVVLQCHQNLDTGPSSLYHSPPPAFFFTIHIETSSFFLIKCPSTLSALPMCHFALACMVRSIISLPGGLQSPGGQICLSVSRAGSAQETKGEER